VQNLADTKKLSNVQPNHSR